MHPKLDIGTLIAAATEQVFTDGISGEGASGSGWVDREGNLVIAPLSFSWAASNAYHPPSATTPAGSAGASGTSYTISGPLVNRMLNPNTPANGVNGQYLVPTLGIIVGGPVDAYTLWYQHSTAYYAETQMTGVIISALATQAYYNATVRCGSNVTAPVHTVTPPSLLNAPLDEIISGNPPTTFPAIPNGGNANTLVILKAIEGHLNKRDWIWQGSDAGLGTISGAILGTGHWVGDVIRVRIVAVNPVTPNDETQNWDAIYSVTLQAVDPFWDIAYGVPFATYASLVLIDERSDPPTYVVPYGVTLPVPLRGTLPGSRSRPSASPHWSRNAGSSSSSLTGYQGAVFRANNVVHATRDMDTSRLPTIIEYYINRVAEEDPSVRSELERSLIARDEFIANRERHAPAMFRHSAPHFARATVHHPAPAAPATHKKPQHQPPKAPARRPGQQHLRGRRQ
jgi:hypothetical protein